VNNILEVKNLKTYFYNDAEVIKAVDDVSFSIAKNSVVGIVGESGCGKTITALSITRLLPKKNCRIAGGRVEFDGKDIVTMEDDDLIKIRGRQISYVFQEPTTSLNPVLNIKEQLEEAVFLHRPDIKHSLVTDFIIEQLKSVGIKPAEEKILFYPHQLSGGEKQRVMIAMAVVCRPKLLIADEPTTALDVTIQAQILDLIKKLKNELELSVMFISHDLDVIAEACDSVAVMYAGKIVEFSGIEDLVRKPNHPYTQGLFACLPRATREKSAKLQEIPGEVPSLADVPKGCAFHPRCPKVFGRCKKEIPPLFRKNNSEVRCWLYSG